jgi:hypothetical protein
MFPGDHVFTGYAITYDVVFRHHLPAYRVPALWFAGFHLDVARLVGNASFGRQSRLLGNFNVVDHLNSAGRFRHARGGAFVLHHVVEPVQVATRSLTWI